MTSATKPDLLERLDEIGKCVSMPALLCREAAAEIRRLQAQLATAPPANQDRTATVLEAIAHYGGKWPEQMYSGVMFYRGLRITHQEFVLMKERSGL